MTIRQAQHDDADLAAERRHLLEDLCVLDQTVDLLEWQRRLADAIIATERGRPGCDPWELKLHRHLLRVIGDGLVHSLVSSHTIRTLGRSPGKPAHVASQGDDFEFVFDCARDLYASGFMPIIADLTTLVGVGDLVAVTGRGIAILECKNRQAPTAKPTGRLARQLKRGMLAQQYLSTSTVDEDDLTRSAVPSNLPEADYECVTQILEGSLASPAGIAIHHFGERDLLIACKEGADLEGLDVAFGQSSAEAGGGFMGVAILNELVTTASHRRPSPSNYPIAADLRWRLLEGDIQLVRIADLGRLSGSTMVGDVELTLSLRKGATGIELVVEGTGFEQAIITSELTELCMWTPIAVETMRLALVDQARSLVSEYRAVQSEGTNLADGDFAYYATVFRNATVTDSNESVADQRIKTKTLAMGQRKTPKRGR